VVVATTTNSSDDPVVAFCKERGYQFTRGSGQDVLDRYYQTTRQMKADVIVRITGDCPLIDPELIDKGVALLIHGALLNENFEKSPKTGFDFVANRLPPPWGRTYPIGLDFEIFTFDFLENAWNSASELHQREHVTPFFYEEVPSEDLTYRGPNIQFSATETRDGRMIALMHHTPDYGKLRWTVDTQADLQLVRAFVSYFKNDTFTWKDILNLTLEKPELNLINAHIQHKSHLDVDARM
jgi:spore coat polysaccharide biosynthesis protein SpsF